MIHARLNTVSVNFPVDDSSFRATGTTVIDPGFLAVYEEGQDNKSDDDDAKRRLPKLVTGDVVPLADILADQHFTEPPPRYSEASLVKALEEFGIGRPSTYASIIQVLQNREYVWLDSRRFKPSDVGRTVSNFLSEHFSQYVDYDFTAKLEDDLDAVSRGDQAWVPLMQRFWKPFKSQVDEKIETVDRGQATGARELGTDPKTGKPVSVRLGRYGPFAQLGTREDEEKPQFASLRPGQSMHTIELDAALELFKLPRKLGLSADGEDVSAGIGRFGPFVKQGKTYASLPKEEDPHTVTLERALELIRDKLEMLANRVIKEFDSGVQVLNGRYGPYITDGEKNARVPKDREPASLTETECNELLAAAPVRKRRGAAKKATKKAAKKATKKTTKKATKKTASKKTAAKKAAAKKTAKKAASKKASGTTTSDSPTSGD
jgi:DNA topoisomerase-1